MGNAASEKECEAIKFAQEYKNSIPPFALCCSRNQTIQRSLVRVWITRLRVDFQDCGPFTAENKETVIRKWVEILYKGKVDIEAMTAPIMKERRLLGETIH